MPPGSPAPAAAASVLVLNRVLILYRILRGGDTTGVATPRDPLVGRREELAFLRDRLADALAR